MNTSKKILILIATVAVILIVTFVFIFLFLKNENNENVDGGECSYKTFYYPAIILEKEESHAIYKYNAVRTISVVVKGDTMDFNLGEEEYSKVHVGDTITYISEEIQSGTCSPGTITISIERYGTHHENFTLE